MTAWNEIIDENIEDLARPDRGPFYTESLWTEILPGLWQGGTDDYDTVQDPRPGVTHKAFITPKDFDTVITLYAWAQPVDWFVKEVRYGFWDAHPKHMDVEQILDVALFAYQEWKAERKVLVRCQAGLNRSGLITALVMMMSGLTAEQAIRMQRRKRCESVLCNEEFEEWLLNFPTEILRELVG